MGIVEKLLTEFSTSDGSNFRIELNRNGVIHLHVDNTRFDLSETEFIQLGMTILEARDELVQIKELDGDSSNHRNDERTIDRNIER